MKQSTFLLILRMPLIKRWALMHTVKRENIAEHSPVAVIAHLLAVIKKEVLEVHFHQKKQQSIALYHEISESKLQDINHVTKYHNPEITREFKKLEKISEQECLASLPKELQNLLKLLVQDDVDPDYKRLVKAADIISAYLKANDEIRFGNADSTSSKIDLQKCWLNSNKICRKFVISWILLSVIV